MRQHIAVSGFKTEKALFPQEEGLSHFAKHEPEPEANPQEVIPSGNPVAGRKPVT